MDTIKNKRPFIRFPEFTKNWEHKQLNKLLSVSKTKNKNLKYGKKEVLSVSGELGVVNQIEHLGRSYAGVSVHNYGILEINQIVYTKSPLKANPYGIIKLNKHKAGIVSTLYAVYSVNEETDGQFVEYYFSLDANLNRYLRPLVRKGAKNDMKISNEYVLNDRIFVPELAEQQKIASFLNIIDDKLQQLTNKKELLNQYKKGMMQKLFNQKLRFKDENRQDFPEWEVKKLGEVCKVYSGGTPKSSNKSYYKGDIPFIGSGNISDNEVFQFITKEALSNSSSKMVEVGDLLYALYGGTSGEVSISKIKGAINQAVLCINTTENKQFLYQFLKFDKERIIKTFLQGGQGNLSAQIIKNLKVLFPKKNEQKKIANFLSKIDDKINIVKEKIENTKAFKKGLLQQMFV
tara:strand:+ start:987 stop:2198 length:1212 start_codon:yes stop_codon:yes gene_type:complete